MVSLCRNPAPLETFMEALLSSFLLVGLGEIGDKTQLLSLALILKFRKPWPILAGVVIATLPFPQTGYAGFSASALLAWACGC